MYAALALLAPLFAQDPSSLPAWPESFADFTEQRDAYIAATEDSDRAERALILVDAIASFAPPADATDWMLGCAANGGLETALADRGFAVLRARGDGWAEGSGFDLHLLQVLDAAPGAEPAPLLAAIRVAGELRVVEAVPILGRLLDSEDLAVASRGALFQLTRCEFRDARSFSSWWEASQALGREAWLEAADLELRTALLALWKERLEDNPAAARIALLDPVAAVREAALEVLKVLPPDDPANGEALRAAIPLETRRDLRVRSIALVPRFLEGETAVALLDWAMDQSEEERLAAVRGLATLQPPELARSRLHRHLAAAYASDPPLGLPAFRRELIGSLSAVGSGPDQEGFVALFLTALQSESDLAARKLIFESAGSLGNTNYLRLLKAVVEDSQENIQLRVAALESSVAIAARHGAAERVLPVLHALLVSPEAALRHRALQQLHRLPDATTAPVLVALLADADIERQQQILRALAAVPGPDGFQPLLAAPIDPSLGVDYIQALRHQAGDDLSRVVDAAEALHSRGEASAAVALLDGLPAEGVSEAVSLRAGRLLVIALSDAVGVNESEPLYARYAEAVDGLNAWIEKESSSDWPLRRARLQIRRRDYADASDAYRLTLARLPDGEDPWPLRLEAAAKLVACREVSSLQEALVFLDGEVPEAHRSSVASLRSAAERSLAELQVPPEPPSSEPESDPQASS